MKWVKWSAIALGALALLLILLPFLITLNDYIPEIEKTVSTKLKEPVSIKSIQFSALPYPRIIIDAISVGTSDDIRLGKVVLTPQLSTLLGSTKVFRSIEINSLVATQKAIEKIAAMAKADTGRTEPGLRIETIRVEDATVALEKTTFGPFDARIALGEKNEPQHISLTTRDGKLKATITPGDANYRLDIEAKSFQSPVEPALLFDELALKGTATTSEASFSEINAKLYQGTVRGKAVLGWEKSLHLKGNLDITDVELKDLGPLLVSGRKVSGRLVARPVFSAQGDTAEHLKQALRVDTSFNIKNGVLYGVDIQKAAVTIGGSSSGETRFDQLAGHLNMDRGAFHFSQLKVSSGLLAADGSVNISARKELSGRLNAKVGASIASAAIPLDVSGTLTNPVVFPSKLALAGAAVGTVFLPGVGTGVGLKAGTIAETLFGRDPKKGRK